MLVFTTKLDEIMGQIWEGKCDDTSNKTDLDNKIWLGLLITAALDVHIFYGGSPIPHLNVKAKLSSSTEAKPCCLTFVMVGICQLKAWCVGRERYIARCDGSLQQYEQLRR